MKSEENDILKLINPDKVPLTVEILRTFSGCENYTDEEAENVVRSIEVLARVAFHVRAKLLKKQSENFGNFNEENQSAYEQ